MGRIKAGIGWPHEVTRNQLEITFCRSGGKGGQNVNKRNTACKMKHLPTGLTSQAQEHRTQELNKAAAFKRLAEQLIPIMKNEHRKERYLASDVRVRTYKQKENLVIDERVSNKVFAYDQILEGNLEDLIDSIALLESTKLPK